jgi:paraquat-inducible protein B
MTAATLRLHPPKVVVDTLNLVTGQKTLALDFTAPRGAHDKLGTTATEGDAIVLNGEGGGFDDVAASIGRIASKIDAIPFDDIGKSLDATLRSVEATVGSDEMQTAVRELSATMSELHQLVRDADQGLAPALAKLPAIADQLQQAVANANHALGGAGYGANSDFQRNMQRLMKQMSEAARSVRMLAEDLDRHPESILRGRSESGGTK